jgi:hypothetical protein
MVPKSALNIFLLKNLPAAFFSGVRIRDLNKNSCITSVKYSWFTKNPFRSIYFACLSMAAELSTGALAFSAVKEAGLPISMLVVSSSATFEKKARGRILFSCDQGNEFVEIVKKVEEGEKLILTAHSTGKNEKGEVVARFQFTWSFSKKERK